MLLTQPQHRTASTLNYQYNHSFSEEVKLYPEETKPSLLQPVPAPVDEIRPLSPTMIAALSVTASQRAKKMSAGSRSPLGTDDFICGSPLAKSVESVLPKVCCVLCVCVRLSVCLCVSVNLCMYVC